jgi:predicted nucleic acid-binding protein
VFLGYLDASALVKRYVAEQGTPVVDHLFRRVPLARMLVTAVGTAEVVSVLVRKFNGGRLTPATYQQALSDYQAEINQSSPIRIIDVTAALAERAYGFVERHSINSTDAILLTSALALAPVLQAHGNELVVVASDRRLVTAARAENLTAFDPERQSITELDALIGP